MHILTLLLGWWMVKMGQVFCTAVWSALPWRMSECVRMRTVKGHMRGLPALIWLASAGVNTSALPFQPPVKLHWCFPTEPLPHASDSSHTVDVSHNHKWLLHWWELICIMFDLMFVIFKCQLGFKLELSAPNQTIVCSLQTAHADSLHSERWE